MIADARSGVANWRPIPSLPGLEASDTGLIRLRGRIKHQYPLSRTENYMRIKWRNKTHLVHRLVAEAFLGPSPLEVNHKDGVKNSNHLHNLEYVTTRENIIHAYATGLNDNVRSASSAAWKRMHRLKLIKHSKGEAHVCAKLTEQKVREIRKSPLSRKKLALVYGVSESTIRSVKERRSWKHVT